MSKLRIFLLVWVIISFVATVFGGYNYLQNDTSKPSEDVSVSSGNVTCYGGCLYFGAANYPVGTACRGIKPGDPAPGYPGGVWPAGASGGDFQDRCFLCQANGQFVGVGLEYCTHCYAHTCIKEGGAAEYQNGDLCAYRENGGTLGIVQCNAGKWVPPSPAKCTGACKGDAPGTVYDRGHTCLGANDDSQCYVCENPGSSGLVLGGFKSYSIGSEKCASVRPDPQAASCPEAQCIGDGAPRTYREGEICHTPQTVSAELYGTYRCGADGEWVKLNANDPDAKCELQNNLYRAGQTITYLGKCYECRTPGVKQSGGFQQVENSVCGIPSDAGGVENPDDPTVPEQKECFRCNGSLGACNVERVDENVNCDGSNGLYSESEPCGNDCAALAATKQCYYCDSIDQSCKVENVNQNVECNGGLNGMYNDENSCSGICIAGIETKTCYECNSITNTCATRTGVPIDTVCDGTEGLYDDNNQCREGCATTEPPVIGDIHPHARADACLGDLNNNGEVNLDDFAIFAGLFEQTLEGDERNLDLAPSDDGTFVMNISDFSLFARNYGKSKIDGSCQERGFILVVN